MNLQSKANWSAIDSTLDLTGSHKFPPQGVPAPTFSWLGAVNLTAVPGAGAQVRGPGMENF